MLIWTIADNRPNLVRIADRWHKVSFEGNYCFNRPAKCPKCKNDKPREFEEVSSITNPEIRLIWNHETFVLTDTLQSYEILCQPCGLRFGQLWRSVKLDEILLNLDKWNPKNLPHPLQWQAREQKIREIRNPMKNAYPVASHFHLKQMTSFKSYEAFLASFKGIHLFMSPAEQAEVQSWLEAKFEGLRGIRKREAEIIAKSFGKPVTSFSLEEDIETELTEAGL